MVVVVGSTAAAGGGGGGCGSGSGSTSRSDHGNSNNNDDDEHGGGGETTSFVKKRTSQLSSQSDDDDDGNNKDDNDNNRHRRSASGGESKSDTKKRKQRRGGTTISLYINLLMVALCGLAGLQIYLYHVNPNVTDVSRLPSRAEHLMNPDHWKEQQEQEPRGGNDNQVGASSGMVINSTAINGKTAAAAEDSSSGAVVTANYPNTVENNPLLRVIQAARVEGVPKNVSNQFPAAWRSLVRLYDLDALRGKPAVVGLETCLQYRNTVALPQRYTAAAGMFNTGTNALEYHLRDNVRVKSPWQIPWGKHRVAAQRLHHAANGLEHLNQTAALPVVIIRDPFHWMVSMCKAPYAAKWRHGKWHCPNLVPTEEDLRHAPELKKKQHQNNASSSLFPVTVVFDRQKDVRHWESLVHLWNDWYSQYLNEAKYPRLMIRFEDMLVRAPDVVRAIGECMGVRHDADNPGQFSYQVNTAKAHGSRADFVQAILKTATETRRLRGMTAADVAFAARYLDPTLMRTFHYKIPTTKEAEAILSA